jgi:MFS family permease
MKDIKLATLIAFILFMASGVTGPVSSLYAESLGAGYVTIGLLGTVTSLTMIVSSYVWGRASDVAGQRKGFLAASLATLSLSYGLVALVPGWGWLFPVRVLGAFARAGYGTSSLALMGDLLERGPDEQGLDNRGRRMGTFRGLASLGFGLMALISGSIADWLSLRVPFALASLFSLVAFVIALRIRDPLAGPQPAASRLTLRSVRDWARRLLVDVWAGTKASIHRLGALARRRAGWGAEADPVGEGGETRLPLAPLLISAFLWSLVTGAVYAVWANYMVGELAYSQAAMTALWALASTSEFPLMILAGWLSDRIGRLPMLSLGFTAWTLVFVGYVVAPVMPWIVLVQLVRGFAYSAYTATAMTYAAEVRGKEQRGWASGLYGSAGGLGAILGSTMGGALTQVAGFRAMIALNAGLIFLGALYLAVEALRWSRCARAAQSSRPSVAVE